MVEEPSGGLVALLGRVRALALRGLGLASRRDVRAAHDALWRQLDRAARRDKTLEHDVTRVLNRLEEMQTLLGGPTRGLDARLRHLERNVDSLVRRQYLDQASLPFPQRIQSQRFRQWSQNEEDGLTLALFNEVGMGGGRFVDIGAGGNGGNSGFLADGCGWTGLMVEVDQARVDRLAVRFGRHGVQTSREWVTRENVNELIERHGLTGEIDLFSIDIDGNDYWVWQALTVCSPRVVMAEFNPFFGRSRSVVVRYDPAFDRARYKDICPRFYGASLGAFARLASTLGYRLVLAEPRGANAYFLRDDVGVSIPGASAETVHPRLVTGEDELFDLIAREHLPLVDLDLPQPGPPSGSTQTGAPVDHVA